MSVRERMNGHRSRLSCLLGAGVLLAGGLGASVLLTAGTADASQCSPSSPTTGSCFTDGNLDLSAGSLSLEAPATLSWASAISGYNLNLVDTTTGDNEFTIIDPTGSNDGWNVTAAATTFTDTTTSVSLGNAGTFQVNGSTSSETSTVLPANACATGSSCTAPATSATGGPGSTDSVVTYPVDITTAATSPTAYLIYNADASSGEGANLVDPVGWWLNVPGNTQAGAAYASVITMVISSGPATA